MLTKKQAAFINSLKKKKYRDKHGMFVAEGVKIVNELIASGATINKIYSSKNYQLSLFDFHVTVERITEDELKKISSLSTPNEVLAICNINHTETDVKKLKSKLILFLDTIQDPGNLGTIIRIADWFGIKYIVCTSDTVDLYNPKVIQATMGSFARVQVWYENGISFIDNYKKHFPDYKIIGASLGGDDLYQTDLPEWGMIVIGNESNGISEVMKDALTAQVRIPSFSDNENTGAESLNAAVATSIICAEFRRRAKFGR